MLIQHNTAAITGALPYEKIYHPFEATSKIVVYQKTIATPVQFEGVGVHSGETVHMTIKPAPANSGFTFVRTDLEKNNRIKAKWSTVTDTSMSTRISNDQGISVSTIEHVLAALAGLQIQNALIELDGPEVPIMDGSSVEFVKKLLSVGVRTQTIRVKSIRVLKPIQVTQGNATAFLLPSNEPRISIEFNFNNRLAETSFFSYYPDSDNFSLVLSPARTFGLFEDAQKLRAAGLAKGASLKNTIVIGETGIMNEDGLRYKDELVRHKVLDALGDLSLAGARLMGHFYGVNSGHGLNNKILRALFEDPAAWIMEETNENSLWG